MSSKQNIQMNREEFRKSGKLISKVGDVIPKYSNTEQYIKKLFPSRK